MKIGFIGLGKMGYNMVQRLIRDGHQVVVYDRSKAAVRRLIKKNAEGSDSLVKLVDKLPGRKVIWLMVPAGTPVDDTVSDLEKLLNKNDIIIDGGNSFWRDSIRRAEFLNERGIRYIDCGTSGGVWGLENGYCLMYGGDKSACGYCKPVFKSLAPENGYLYCGESGAGHFVKMVHNGIEYGMMQAYAEGFELMEKSPFNINLKSVSAVWQHGSVIRSWLLELTERALSHDPDLEGIEDYVEDSGEGRWTVNTAIDFNVPAHIISSALFSRLQSRQKHSFAMKLIAALRNQFGGHAMKNAEE